MMTINKDPYKAHCERCNYDWIKKTTRDPVCCPNCHSRKYKEPKNENSDNEPRRALNGQIVIPDLFTSFCENDNSYVLCCPICGYNYCFYDGNENGVDKFSGECGHTFGFSFDFYKGETIVKVVRFADKEFIEDDQEP